MSAYVAAYWIILSLLALCLTPATEEQRGIRAFHRALLSLMREAMKNICSASIPQCWGDRTGILEQAYITCACCLALHVQGEGGLCWSCSLGTARAAPGSCRVSACAGVSLVQAVCHSLPAWATRVSALCLTHSDRDLPTRLLLPRSNFSCSIPQPSTAGESPSKTVGCSVWCDLGGENQEWLCFCCATGGAHKDQ